MSAEGVADVMERQGLKSFFSQLQDSLIHSLEALDGAQFRRDDWRYEGGGGGTTCLLEEGDLFERACVNFSHVFGRHLPLAAMASRPELAGSSFEVMGVSSVIHPRNPYVPTAHLNVRYFSATGTDQGQTAWWFGGCMDLTPCYGFVEDVCEFHAACRDCLLPFGPDLYPAFKKWCDEYFFLKHRNEPRGVGGIFFDDLNEGGFARCFSLVRSVAGHFPAAYFPIVERRRAMAYGERERAFQAFRRSRYAEFNLIQDRGTRFGLQSGGRAESILASLPPTAAWRYDWRPEPGSSEEALSSHFLAPRNWITHTQEKSSCEKR